MKREKELLIFDNALNLYTRRGLPGDCIDDKNENYASLQSLHHNYLSNVIKMKTGKTVSSWITEKTIAEAKSLMQNSSTLLNRLPLCWALQNLPISAIILK